ncbi:hypothetical protein [Streptomyces sp. GbtcB7]|uniref:hypothetical protein n=1 Tax=Streptomyces sp. GbtcB7 TaxID=2824752 RepID=UPI001C310FB8|nr:hypothetical protein [Streptomyces sp. GbtcB7]
MKNVEVVLSLAGQVGLPALMDVINASSGDSAALRTLSGDTTPESADHVHLPMEKGMHHFADALRSTGGGGPSEVLERSVTCPAWSRRPAAPPLRSLRPVDR